MTRLRAAREAADMTQTEAAKVIGKTQGVYAKIEAGIIHLRFSDAVKLADAFSIDLETLK